MVGDQLPAAEGPDPVQTRDDLDPVADHGRWTE
jgi:hypothetical protein